MELKTLILGLFLSTAAFAVKAGGGPACSFLQTPGELDGMLGSGKVIRLPVVEYKKRFGYFSKQFKDKIIEQWGG